MLGATACGARAHDPSGAASAASKTVELPAGEFHEECLELTRRQRLHYAFRSPQPLDFNIHHHRGNDIVYPVRRKNLRSSKTVFAPRHDDGYCMMWTNSGRNSVKLHYQFSIRLAPASK